MRKTLLVIIFSGVLSLVFFTFQTVSSQTRQPVEQKNPDEKSETLQAVEEEDYHYSSKWLRNDMRASDVVAYVDVKEVKFADRSDEQTDCENNTKGGYCAYLLIAEVKEVFKGKIETKPFEFYGSADATYPKKNFLGEWIVFLVGSEGKDKKRDLNTIENSSRAVDEKILQKMRNIVDPQAPVDDNDGMNPYALKYIDRNFREADAVVYADVKSLKPAAGSISSTDDFTLTASIKEVFKGGLKPGRTFEYRDNLTYRPMRDEDLGEQIVYLRKEEEDGKVYYKKIEYTEGWLRHDILEKLRKIAKVESNGKK